MQQTTTEMGGRGLIVLSRLPEMAEHENVVFLDRDNRMTVQLKLTVVAWYAVVTMLSLKGAVA